MNDPFLSDNILQPILANLCDASDPAGEEWFDKLDDAGKQRIMADGRRRGEQAVRKLLTAMDARDGRALELLLHTGNKIFRRAFQVLTKVDLGTTEQAARDGVRQFVGTEEYDRQKAARLQAQADKDAAEQAARDKRARDGKLSERVRYTIDRPDWRPGLPLGLEKSGTIREFIDELVSLGYSTVEGKRGFRKILKLQSDRISFTLNTKIEQEYALERIASREAARSESA